MYIFVIVNIIEVSSRDEKIMVQINPLLSQYKIIKIIFISILHFFIVIL